MAMVCSKCGRPCATAMDLVSHDCPREAITVEDLQDFAKMLDEQFQKIGQAIQLLGNAVDDLRARVAKMEAAIQRQEVRR